MTRNQRTVTRLIGWGATWAALAAWAMWLLWQENYAVAYLVVCVSAAPAIWAGRQWDKL